MVSLCQEYYTIYLTQSRLLWLHKLSVYNNIQFTKLAYR
jgi:hypothetical protein